MRYLPHTDTDIKTMLAAAGAQSLDDLVAHVPKECRGEALTQPERMAEPQLLKHYQELAGEPPLSFVGAGLYRHYVPVAVDSLISRGEFFTAYTPYQPEVAQGTLQGIYEFQTVVAELFGLELANASMYDGASAAAEAALMAIRLGKNRKRVVVSEGVHPDTLAVVETYLSCIGIEVEIAPLEDGITHLDTLFAKYLDEHVACVIAQSPNALGQIEPMEKMASLTHESGAKFVACVQEPTSLGLLKPPGAIGADIAVGEGTGLGVPPSFGGPGVGLFATHQRYLRQMPGRLCGEAKDKDGNKGYVLTLSTREQHIRRERATSNICTNNGLCALAFTMHAVMLGPVGLRDLATQCAKRARYLVQQLDAKGIKRRYQGPIYNEFVLDLGDAVNDVIEAGAKKNIAVGFDLSRWRESWKGGLLVCANELHDKASLHTLVDTIAEVAA